MKTNNKNLYNSLIITLFLFGSACADDNSSKLQNIIDSSLKNKSKQTDRADIRKTLQWPTSCEERFNFPTSGLTFFKQSNDQYIAQITCTYGSYQGMSLFYKINLSKNLPTTTQIKLPTYNSKSNSVSGYSSEIWGNVLTTSTVKEFNILNLYSGYGHCGSLTTYDLSGKLPKIIKLKMQSDCDTKEKIRDYNKWKAIKVK